MTSRRAADDGGTPITPGKLRDEPLTLPVLVEGKNSMASVDGLPCQLDTPTLSPAGQGTFQARVKPWMLECFGPVIPFDKQERGDRLLEEVFELLQSGGYDPARVLALRDYVWGRDVGEPYQEMGGVMVTLAAYGLAHDLDMAECGETELARIWTKVPLIRAKQAAKPTGSALPIATSSPAQVPGDQTDAAGAGK